MEENFNFSHFNTFEKDGKIEKIDKLGEYLKKEDIDNITYKKRLNIGDEVKIKGVDYTVVVEFINYEIPGLGMVDYAGKRKDKKDELLCLFNQKDIEQVISRPVSELEDSNEEER